jgi:acyl-homoserine-lactone acylase
MNREKLTRVAVHCGLLIAIAAGALSGCGRGTSDGAAAPTTPPPAAQRFAATVERTSHGIPHIRSDDFSGLGYGLAYAYAQDNVCMFADSLLTVRGERSRFFGPEAIATAPANGEYGAASTFFKLKNEDSDFFFKAYLDIEQLRAAYQAGSKDARDMLAGYAAGYNRYLKDAAGKLPAACAKAAWVKPITVDDMYLVVAEKALHASGEVFAKEIVDAARASSQASLARLRSSSRVTERGFMQARLDRLTREQLGSNALALGKDATVNGRGILLGNPHYPWTSTDRFYQAHLTIPGRYDAMGVILGGIPTVVIGFNKDVAWTHTVTTAVHFTTFKLALDPRDASGTTYLVDGKPEQMSSRTVSVDSLRADGTIATRSKTFYFTRQGFVMFKPEAGLNWSAKEEHVLGDPNRTNPRLIEKWIGIASAKNVQELKASLDKIVGLPWVNTAAADRDGNTLFADASVVPRVGPDKFASDCFLVPQLLMFDGSRASCAWGAEPNAPAGIYSPVNGPWTIRTDYVGNSNDSYWLSNADNLLTGPYSPLYGPVEVPQKLRTRIGFKQTVEALSAKKKLSIGDVQQLAFANRIYAAELVLPDLLPKCANPADRQISRACNVLAAWDRRADLDSRGALLFREFWNAANQIADKWEVPFDARDPVNTPRGIAPGAMPAMVAALKTAASKLETLAIPLDARLGDYQTETRNGVKTGVHGAIGDPDGSYNSIHMASDLTRDGYLNIEWGTSYVQTVGFEAGGPIAYGMLLYGQSVDPTSPHYADQIAIYARKEWPRLPFSPAEIRTDPDYKVMRLAE